MAIKQFLLENLLSLDGGRVAAAFNSELKTAALDIEDREMCMKPRTITLICELTPDVVSGGVVETVKAKMLVKTTLPRRTSNPCILALRRQGMLVFNEDARDNPHQQPLLPDDAEADDD